MFKKLMNFNFFSKSRQAMHIEINQETIKPEDVHLKLPSLLEICENYEGNSFVKLNKVNTAINADERINNSLKSLAVTGNYL